MTTPAATDPVPVPINKRHWSGVPGARRPRPQVPRPWRRTPRPTVPCPRKLLLRAGVSIRLACSPDRSESVTGPGAPNDAHLTTHATASLLRGAWRAGVRRRAARVRGFGEARWTGYTGVIIASGSTARPNGNSRQFIKRGRLWRPGWPQFSHWSQSLLGSSSPGSPLPLRSPGWNRV